MVVLKEKSKNLREGVNLVTSLCLEDLRSILSMTGKKMEILVSGKGSLMLYDDDAIECIEETPFNFNKVKATVQMSNMRLSGAGASDKYTILYIPMGKNTLYIGVQKNFLVASVNEDKSVSDWALYSTENTVVDFTRTSIRSLRGNSESLDLQLKINHPDDERSDDSAQPLPIFEFLAISVTAL